MEISETLFKFLVRLDIIPQEATRLNNQLVRLPKEMSSNFENAKYFAKIAKQINRMEYLKNNQPEQPLSHIGGFKEGNTPAAKLYNWNILLPYYLSLGISIHPDQKTLIAAGDHNAANHVLNTLHQYILKKYPDYIKYVQNNNIKSPQVLSPSKRNEKEKEDSIDLKKIQVDKDPNQTTSSLELLTILISKSLHLTPCQSATLFCGNCKYLAHVIVKGVKGLFDPIILLYQYLNEYYIHLIDLSTKNDFKYLFFMLNALKPGLICQNQLVSELGCKLILSIGIEMNKRQLSNKAWEWFINDNNSGLYNCIKCIKRHVKLADNIVQIFYQYGQYNFVELFITYLKVEIPDTKDYMNFISTIISPITNHQFILQEILQNGIMEDWLDVAFECSQHYIETQLRLQALNFLSECWINHANKIEEIESRANQIIQALIEGCNDSNQSVILGIDSLTQLFRLLKKLGLSKNYYAPKIYKAVSQVLVMHFENINMREYSLQNFREIFEEIPSIPVSIMLEPYIARIQGEEQLFERLNVCDFVFLSYVSERANLNSKIQIQLLDLLGKVLLNNIIFSNIVHTSFLSLLNKCIDNQEIQNYLNKFIKITLAMYYASEKKKKPKEKILPLYNNQAASKSQVILPSELEIELINAQKRTKAVEILKSIAHFQCKDINKKMKPLVAHTEIQLEDFFNQPNKGMLAVLECFGDPKSIIQDYRNEYEQHLEQQRKEKEEREEQQELENEQNMNEDERLVTENVRKYGIGLKKKKVMLTKEEQYKLAQLRKPQETDQKVLQIIEDKKREFSEKQKNEQKKKEEENQQLEKQKQLLRKQLEKRSIQQGISTQNKHDMEANLLFEFNSREKEMKKEKKNGLPEITYFDMNLEEQRDQQMVDIILKKYQKLFRNIFIKYSNSTQTFDNQIKTFDKLKDRNQSITVAEAWKIIKDYELTSYIHQEEHKSIFRIINTQYFKKKTDLQQLDFNGFKQFIIQFSYHFCSKPPQDLRHLPISCSIEKLIEYMRGIAKKQGQNVAIFDNPDKLLLGGEADVIEQFNQQLQNDPDIQLPNGYKKIKEKELTFNYDINPNLKLPLGIKYGFEILNEIFMKNLGFSIIEAKTEETTTFKAQPQILIKVNTKPQYLEVFKEQEMKREQQKQNSKSPSPKSRKRMTSADQNDNNGLDSVQLKIGNKIMNPILTTFGVQNKYRNKRVLEIDQFKQLPVKLKVEVSKMNIKDRYTSEQVALVLDDILDAVEHGKSAIRKQGIANVQNHFQRSKEDEVKEKQQESQFQMKRIKERKLELNDQLDKIKKQKEEEDKKKKEEEKKKQEEAEKKKLDQQKKFKQNHQEQKSKILEYNKQKEEQIKKEKEEKELAQKEKRKQHNEQFESYNQNKQQKLREEWQKKKQESAEKQAAQVQQDEKQKSQQKKLHKKIKDKIQEILEIEQVQNQKIDDFIQSSEAQEVFKENEKAINTLFDFLERYTFKQITNPAVQQGEIPLKIFSWFCFHFNLYPEIITPNEVILIFKSITKNKPSMNGAPMGLNKSEFKNALGRICIKGARVFNLFNEKRKQNNEVVEEDDMEQILKENEEEQIQKQKDEEEQQQQENNEDNKKQDQQSSLQLSQLQSNSPKQIKGIKNDVEKYPYIDQTNSLTLQAMINYLAIPTNKAAANHFFQNKLQHKHIPDSFRKRELLKKLNHDPSELISFKSIDHNDSRSKRSISPNKDSQIFQNDNQKTPEKKKINNNNNGSNIERSKSPEKELKQQQINNESIKIDNNGSLHKSVLQSIDNHSINKSNVENNDIQESQLQQSGIQENNDSNDVRNSQQNIQNDND